MLNDFYCRIEGRRGWLAIGPFLRGKCQIPTVPMERRFKESDGDEEETTPATRILFAPLLV